MTHGTMSGRNWHGKRREPLCSECARFWADYMAVKRLSGRASHRNFGEATQMLVIHANAKEVSTEAELRDALTKPEVFWW